MGKAKRCRTVVIGVGAALAAAPAGPAGAAAPEHGSPSPAVARMTQRAHSRRRRQQRPAAAPHGPYVYAVAIGAEIREENPNAACVGNSIRLTSVALVMPETRITEALLYRYESFWGKRATITAGPATTITTPWSSAQETREAEQNGGMVPDPHDASATAPAARICAATTPNAALGSIGEGVVTWRLPRPATSVAALLAQAPANVNLNELMVAFAIQPDGSVPPFNP